MTHEQICQKINDALDGWDDDGDPDAVIGAINEIDSSIEHHWDMSELAWRALYDARKEFESGSPQTGEHYLLQVLAALGGKRREAEDADEQMPESIADDGSIAVAVESDATLWSRSQLIFEHADEPEFFITEFQALHEMHDLVMQIGVCIEENVGSPAYIAEIARLIFKTARHLEWVREFAPLLHGDGQDFKELLKAQRRKLLGETVIQQRHYHLLREVARCQLATWGAIRALEKECGYDIADEDIVNLIDGVDDANALTNEQLEEFFAFFSEVQDAN